MTVKNLFKKLVPGVLALALTAGAVAPAGLTLAGVKDAFVATASAEETALRKIRFLGGALGDTITMKVIFCADAEVEYVSLTNPNKENTEDKFYVADCEEYTDDNVYSNDYYIEMPVYPKNMAETMTFKMYNAAGNALQFGNSQTIMPDDYDYDEKNFSANDYLEQVRDSVM
nr:hypothetical protein [Lachnospiraceae bacterium]